MAKFAVALFFLFVAGVTLGTEVDNLFDAIKAPLSRDVKKCDLLIKEMAADSKTLADRVLKNEKSVNNTIETDFKEFETKATKWIKQYPRKAKTIKSKISEMKAEAENHATTVITCMREILANLTTRHEKTAVILESVSKNVTRTLTGIKECSKDNDYSTTRCGLRYMISRKCDYLEGVTELLADATLLHSTMETAITRVDNTCGLAKTIFAFRRATAQAESDLRKTFHSG